MTWDSSRALGSRRGSLGDRTSAVGSTAMVPSPTQNR